jgi:hypothetical protein
MAPAKKRDEAVEVKVDVDLCEFAAVAGWLLALSEADLNYVADLVRVPPKQRKRDLLSAVAARWVKPEARRRLREELRLACARYVRLLQEEGLQVVRELSLVLSPASTLWLCAEAGLDPQRALRRLTKAERDRLLRQQQELSEWVANLERWQSRKQAEAAAPKARLQREVRDLRWHAEKAEEKHGRAEKALQQKAEEVERLRAEVAELSRRVKALEEERLILLEQIAMLAAARPAAKDREELPAKAGGLQGKAVLVVGDESRQAEYRAILKEVGAQASFVSGFGNPKVVQAKAEAADLVVFVTAYASHSTWTAVRQAKKPLALVNQAGERAFREALGRWTGGSG